jgi:hypothetical protein
MQTWINFWSFILWLSIISFSSSLNNVIKLIFYSEITWIILYCYVLIQGVVNDDIILLSTSILLLGLAGLEYSIGILLLVIFKNINKNLNISENNEKKNYNIDNTNNIYINRYLWVN